MDQITDNKQIISSDILYTIKDIMKDHHLTADQALYLMCHHNDIEYNISPGDITSLYNKGLLLKGLTINATLLFHLKKPEQLKLDIPFVSKPNGTELTLDRAHRIEKEFVIDAFLTDEKRKEFADNYFKGDLVLARYFIIFKSLFPVKHKLNNAKWNKKFGLIYDGMSLWDDSLRVAKKFIEIYKRLDIGIFLEATYRRVRDSIDLEQQRCFMTKPFKHLSSFDSYYQEVKNDLQNQVQRVDKDTENKINQLKV